MFKSLFNYGRSDSNADYEFNNQNGFYNSPELNQYNQGSWGSLDAYLGGLGDTRNDWANNLNQRNGIFQLGWNAPTMQMGLQGLSALSGLWGATQANKLARQQLNMQTKFANANLNNSIKSYNLQLDDKARARGAMEGQSSAQTQAYIDKHKLSR